jgi:hypothetical protein
VTATPSLAKSRSHQARSACDVAAPQINFPDPIHEAIVPSAAPNSRERRSPRGGSVKTSGSSQSTPGEPKRSPELGKNTWKNSGKMPSATI